MKFLLSVSKGIDAMTTLFGKVAWWLSVVMVLIGAVNVFTRYVGRSLAVSLGGSEYIVLQTYAYNIVFLVGAAYVLRMDAHVRVDIIFSNLSARRKAWVDIFGILVFLIPFTLFGLYLSDRYVATSWRQLEVNMNAGGIPIYPIKTVITIAFALLLAQAISELIKNSAFLAGVRPSRSLYEKEEAKPDAPPAPSVAEGNA